MHDVFFCVTDSLTGMLDGSKAVMGGAGTFVVSVQSLQMRL